MTVFAPKYLALEEIMRNRNDAQYNADQLKDLEAFLEPPSVPILDPGSEYALEVG